MRQFKFQIEGLDDDHGDVRLTVFSEKVAALRRLLREASVDSRGEDTRKLVIQDLSHKSPATITVAGPDEIVDPISECLADAFDQIQQDTFRAFTRYNLLEAAADLVKGVTSAFRNARIIFDKDSALGKIELDDALAKKISILQIPITESIGSAKGRIEIVNIHADQHKFYVYRPAGKPRRVSCNFSDELLPIAKDALGKTVTVSGAATFERDSLLPTEIQVDKIDIHEADDELPTMSDLIGTAPGATGEMDTLEFIEEIRQRAFS